MKYCLSFFLYYMLCAQTISAQQSWIRINQLGYRTHDTKVAVLASKEAIVATEFKLLDAENDKVLFKGNDIESFGNYAAFSHLYRFDFTSLE